MLSIADIRKDEDAKTIVIGSHTPIVQSILDFDFLCGKRRPSIAAIIGSGKRCERFFWGRDECIIPVYASATAVPVLIRSAVRYFANISSGRRALSSTQSLFSNFSNLSLGMVFAENVPEQHALQLKNRARLADCIIAGPASVGILVPGILKLGPIGGVDHHQIDESKLPVPGAVAILSSSGGMTNELVSMVSRAGSAVSFAIAIGGDRFPILSPAEAFLLAEQDDQTKVIAYFGELGGGDEYEIAKLLQEKRITKPVIGYIAGSIEAAFAEPVQFGHAKALSQKPSESASAKKDALRRAGMTVGDTYGEFAQLIAECSSEAPFAKRMFSDLSNRTHALFSSRFSGDRDEVPTLLGRDLLAAADTLTFPAMIAGALLGREPRSKEFVDFLELALKLLVDHGPAVSASVNTIVAARAGKDLVSSLCAGLLTIGDRFGGAINGAAHAWLSARETSTSPAEFVESFASRQEHIPGIGHRKYSRTFPDPRVQRLMSALPAHLPHPYTDFALQVERITTAKKANLILNVDGLVASAVLDMLSENEGMDAHELSEAASAGMFNAIFVLARSVGMIGHYLDQRRHDEGLFRLPNDEIAQL